MTTQEQASPASGVNRPDAPVTESRSYDPHLEGIRGYAAVAVMLFHLGMASGGVEVQKRFDWLSYWSDAGLAVRVFFVLSGYVIGLTTLGVRPSGANIASYCHRRLVRLFPINFWGVLLGCAVATTLAWQTVVGALFFLENSSGYGKIFLPPPDTNGNLWTLNYEALFYTLFILIWILRPRAEILFAGCFAVSICFFRGGTDWVTLSCYATGFLFWLSGYFLATSKGPGGTYAGRIRLSTLILMIVTPKIQDFRDIFLTYVPWSWSRPIFFGGIMRPFDLGVLPVCVVLIAEAAGRPFRGLTLVRVLAYLIAVHGFLHIHGSAAGPPPAFYATMLVAAVVTWRVRLPAGLLSGAAWLGTISFALYVTVYPIQQYVFRKNPPAHVSGAIVNMVVVIVVAFTFAWFLEKRFQPWFRSLIPKARRYS